MQSNDRAARRAASACRGAPSPGARSCRAAVPGDDPLGPHQPHDGGTVHNSQKDNRSSVIRYSWAVLLWKIGLDTVRWGVIQLCNPHNTDWGWGSLNPDGTNNRRRQKSLTKNPKKNTTYLSGTFTSRFVLQSLSAKKKHTQKGYIASHILCLPGFDGQTCLRSGRS